MCGISGYLDFDRKVCRQTLHSMTDIIRHRGPDDEGYMLFGKGGYVMKSGKDTVKECRMQQGLLEENDADDYWLGFGHRRLSIIDLSAAGHQPMADEEGRLAITYNGEIYNYLELREELKRYGYRFATGTDTEVILKSYRKWGEDCVEHFNGMWSFAIYDGVNQKLFCSRDRLGAKPFYYFRKNNHFVFGSEIKQLCQDNMLDRRINEQQLLFTLMLRIQDFSEETLIKDVYSLSPGCSLTVDLDVEHGKILSVKRHRYWELDMNSTGQKENQWYDRIKEAVLLRLRSDVPIGIMVSGGVDSTFLLNEVCKLKAEANPNTPAACDTFTTCYKDSAEHDETYYAHQVNEAWDTKEHLIYPDEEDTLGAYEKMIWHFEDYAPFSTLGAFLTMEQISKSGFKVIINGQGGDESMLGYERYYAYYVKDVLKRNPLKGIKIMPYIVKNSRLSYKLLLQYIVYFGFPRIRVRRNVKASRKLLSREFLDSFQAKKALPVITSRNLNELVFQELRKTQLPHILRMDDRGYMAFSIESRVPFIDYRYLEEAVKIPPLEKISMGYTKYLLREKMVGTIPDEVVWRKNKNGWSSPSERWVKKFDKEKIREYLMHPVSGKYFNMDYIRGIWKSNPTSRDMEAFLFTEVFMREFKIS